MNEIPQLSGMTSSVLSEVTVGVDDGSAQHLHIHKQPGPGPVCGAEHNSPKYKQPADIRILSVPAAADPRQSQ